LLIETNRPGVRRSQMKCSGVWGSGTTYIEFDNVLVPAANLLGEEGKGFKVRHKLITGSTGITTLAH
jgi:alkylation response protein AidB-like acyl-CoA dehydrogenase